MKGTTLILAGGGGHTGYGITLAEYLKDETVLYFLVPDDDPLSEKLAQKYGKVEKITKPRHPNTGFFIFLIRFLKAFFQSLGKIKNPNIIISTGSNFCIPPAIIGWMKGIPIINIESADKLISPSKTARYLQRISKITALQWEDQTKFLKGKVYGPLLPVQQVQPSNEGYILIASGTYGYKKLLDTAITLPEDNVILQTGRLDPEPYRIQQPAWEIISNIPDFKTHLAGADIVITPPGSTALEAAAYNKKLIIVNYPSWSKAGVTEEAKLFAEKLNAPFIQDLTPKTLQVALNTSKKRNITALENGTKQLAQEIIKLI